MAQSPYELHIASFKIGTHYLEYYLDNDFFTRFNQRFNNAQIEVKIILEKKETFLQFRFTIEGIINTVCEKCNTPSFPLEIWEEFDMILKYAHNAAELNAAEEDSDIVYILPHQAFFEIEQYLYEFTMLAMPLVIKCSEKQFAEKTYCNQNVLRYIEGAEYNNL